MNIFGKSVLLGILSVLMIFTTGCASRVSESEKLERSFATPEDGFGGVYIYRHYNLLGCGRSPALVIDKRAVVDIENDSYYYQKLSEGPHTIIVVPYTLKIGEMVHNTLKGENDGSTSIRIDVKSGQNYYVHYTYLTGKLELVSEEEGKKGVMDCDRVE